MAKNTIACLLPEVCKAICEEFKDEVITCPTTPDEWSLIAGEFKNRWNVPHACGALDGKHVAIRCPPNSGSLYHNYKHFFSVVLLALADADYKFLWIDCGGLGSMSDAQIFKESELKQCLEDGTIRFPAPDPLPQDNEPMPYFRCCIWVEDIFDETLFAKRSNQRALSHKLQNIKGSPCD